jgi:hypothetical protein
MISVVSAVILTKKIPKKFEQDPVKKFEHFLTENFCKYKIMHES